MSWKCFHASRCWAWFGRRAHLHPERGS
jgi:hypothetical protein